VANQRSSNSRLLAVGFAVLVIGVLLVLVIIRNGDETPADPAPPSTGQPTDAAAEQPLPLSPEQLATARLPLPLDVPDGSEAVAVRVNFMRGVAAIPAPGDRINVYRLPQDSDDARPETETPTVPGSGLPPRGPDAEQVLTDVEVLAVTGPLPSTNDGTLTFVVAATPDQVPGLLTLANDDELWFTLLPAPDAAEEATEAPA
jgi:Flp pilus assembly protein CpaB